eukprot:Em0007g1540a
MDEESLVPDAKKRKVTVNTFKKWKTKMDKEHQTVTWLECDSEMELTLTRKPCLLVLKQLVDEQPVQVGTKGSYVWFRPKIVFLTSNVGPANLYKDEYASDKPRWPSGTEATTNEPTAKRTRIDNQSDSQGEADGAEVSDGVRARVVRLKSDGKELVTDNS